MSESKVKSGEKAARKTKKTVEVKKEDKPVKKVSKVKKEEDVSKETKKVLKSKKTNDGLLEKKEQKYFRIMTKFISIIAKIVRICAMIIVPILLTVMIIIPLAFKNVEFNGNIIRFNDARFVLKDDNITLNIGDKNYLVADGIKDMDKVIEFFNANSIGKITTNILLSLSFVVVILIINIYVFQYLEKLFKNFYQHKTPFEEDNCDYLRKIGRLMIINWVVAIVFSIILNLVFRNDTLFNAGSYTIMEIIGVYVCYFIFQYGTKMQKITDTTLYDKEI